jgi:hypothetical protein
MVRIRFFSSDDDDPATEKEVDGVRVTSNRDNVNVVEVENGEVSGTPRGLTVHSISLSDSDTDSPKSSGSTESYRKTVPTPKQPSTPKVEPEPQPEPTADPASQPKSTVDPATRRTFVLPDDKHFMQKLEARGKNGHGSIVETVYVLTGPTYTRPTDLIRLDNDKYYGSATRSSVSFNPRAMARKVASLYPDGEAPKLIARFHTHPGGTLRPSSADKNGASRVHQSFVDAFGTDDFEFFHGIHGLEEHGLDPNPDERQSLSTKQKHLRWLGERYRHKLAVFDRNFETKKRVSIQQNE